MNDTDPTRDQTFPPEPSNYEAEPGHYVDADVSGASAAPASPPVISPPPWDAWATVGWTVLAMLVFLAVMIGVGIVVAIVMFATGLADPEQMDLDALAWVGLLGYLVAGPVAVAMLAGVIKLRGWPIGRYIAMVRCSALAMVVSLVIGALYVGGQILLNVVLDRPIPDVMIQMMAFRPAWPVILLAVIVAAPLVEEFIFRGFMYRGLAGSPLGMAGAILITAALWSVIHLQYDWLDISLIFGLGIILGLTRHVTGSIWPAIGIHFLVNLTSMTLMVIYIMLGMIEV